MFKYAELYSALVISALLIQLALQLWGGSSDLGSLYNVYLE